MTYEEELSYRKKSIEMLEKKLEEEKLSLKQFYRAVRLPTSVNEEGSTAKMENGVLTITLPKMQLEEPTKKIAIE